MVSSKIVRPKLQTESTPVRCMVRSCDCVAANGYALKEHISLCHKSRLRIDGTFHCPFPACTSATEQYSNLETHLNRHLGIRPHRCPHAPCAFRTADPAELTEHRRTQHAYVPQKRGPRRGTRRAAAAPRFVCALDGAPMHAVHTHKRRREDERERERDDVRPVKTTRCAPEGSPDAHAARAVLPRAVPQPCPPSGSWSSTTPRFDAQEEQEDAEFAHDHAYRGYSSSPSSSSSSSSSRGSSPGTLATPPASCPPADADALLWPFSVSTLDSSESLTPYEQRCVEEYATLMAKVFEVHNRDECWCHHL